jgi:hypothetical protein
MDAAFLRLRPAVFGLMLLFFVLTVPSSASAAEGYVVEDSDCAGTWGGGQFDENGTSYAACGQHIRVERSNGAVSWYPSGGTAYDVAPSPNGDYLYVTNLSQVWRLNFGGGTYHYDPNWSLGTFPYAGERTVTPYWIAADGWGNIYVSDARFMTVVKFRPDGTFITRFAEYTNGNAGDASSWKPAEIYWRIGGVSVSRDGRHVYVGEVGNSRVQRFDWQPDGSYRFATMWGNTREFDPGRVGSCADGRFAAPYDTGVDPWGYVYVANTTCGQIQKFTKDGAHLYTSPVLRRYNDGSAVRNHGISVDAHGNAASGEPGRRIRRTTAEPGPWPAIDPLVADTTAPTLSQVTVPAKTTTRTITVSVTATDDRRVSHVRIAGEDGNYGGWTGVNPGGATFTIQHTLSAGYGTKGLFVQVRDAAENTSGQLYRTLSYEAPPGEGPDVTAPTITSFTVPATTTTRTISVGVSATDNKGATQMRFANEDGVWGGWIAYAANATHTLTAGNGAKVVFVQVRDAADNRSQLHRTTNHNDPINGPDQIAPLLNSLSAPASSTTREVKLTADATDNRGISAYRIAGDDGVWKAWTAWTGDTIPHTIEGGYGRKVIFVQVRDAAGNESTVKNVAVTYAAPATHAPKIAKFTLPASTSKRLITVKTRISKASATHIRIANEDGTWSGWRTYSRKVTHRLTPKAGVKRVFIQVRSASGKTSTIKSRVTRLI